MTGPDGLLKLFTKSVLETALGEEMAETSGTRRTARNRDASRATCATAAGARP